MLLIRGQSIEQNVAIEPFSDIVVNIRLAGTEDVYKLSIAAHVYYKRTINMYDLASSNTEYIYTDKVSRTHRVHLSIGDFPKDKVTRRIVQISIEYGKIIIEDLEIKKADKSDDNRHADFNVVQDNVVQDIVVQDIVVHGIANNNYIKTDKIIFVSTWNINCGIAYYTKDLIDDLRKLDNGIYKNLFNVNPISHSKVLSNNGILETNITGKLTHLQHESGVMPKPPSIEGKVIMTWHTIPSNISETLKIFEGRLDIVGHIVPCKGALEYMKTSKDVHVIGLGSKLIADNIDISQKSARILLGLENVIGGEQQLKPSIDKPIGLVFGFQSASKNYDRLIKAAKKIDIHLIICGTVHESGYKHPTLSDLSNNDNITVTDNRYVSDSDVDIYALASDLLLFDYMPQNHYSASSAMHRTVGSGRPVICSRINHFSDIEEDKDCLKFNDLEELEDKIKYALDNREEFGKKSLDYARRTSREEMARKHIDLYKKYVDI